MDPPAVRLTDDAAEFPDQRHDGVAGARETFINPGTIHLLQPRGARDCLGSRSRNDANFGLRTG